MSGDLHARLAEALEPHQFVGLVDACWTRCLCGWTSEEADDQDDGSFARHEAQVLLPLVLACGDERAEHATQAVRRAAAGERLRFAAEQLREAADDLNRIGYHSNATWLRARADQLDGGTV